VKPVRTSIFILIAATMLSSCSSYMYIPNSLNMPLPEKKHDFSGAFYAGSEGIGLQSTFALDSHLVILLNGSVSYQSDYSLLFYDPENPDYYFLEGGGGYFNQISNNLKFEMLAGAGYGRSSYTAGAGDLSGIFTSHNTYFANGHFIHSFAQADLGFHPDNNETNELCFGIRISEIEMYGSYDVDHYNSDNTFIANLYHMDIRGNALFIEPGMKYSIGNKNVKFSIFTGFSGKVAGLHMDPQFGNLYQAFSISAGITFKLSQKSN
jgi:hypothetical protein